MGMWEPYVNLGLLGISRSHKIILTGKMLEIAQYAKLRNGSIPLFSFISSLSLHTPLVDTM